MSKPINALFGVLTLVAILAIAPSAFAESGTTVNISAGAGASPNCSQTKNCFDQDVITVAPGTTVTWQNNDKVSHTVTSGNPSDNQTGTIFDSSLIASGKDFSFTFNNPGTYNYFCQVHPWMTGQVIVATGASSSSGSTTSGMNMPSGSSMSGMSNSSSSMNMPSGSSMSGMSNSSSTPQQPANLTSNGFASTVQQGGSQIAQQSGQGQQGGIPLGSSYNAPANMSSTPSTPTQPAPPSQAPQYGSQVPSASQAGMGQQNGIPLGSSYSAPAGSPQNQIPAQVVYNDSDNPTGPLQGMGWIAGMVIAGVLSGVGIWTAVRRR
ncbi:MAG: plastocyanin/azurin family copper-binding protein [Nitrosotalea sp.]